MTPGPELSKVADADDSATLASFIPPYLLTRGQWKVNPRLCNFPSGLV